MKLYVTLSHYEIIAELPYALIYSTRESAVWNSGTRKRRWAQEFTPAERAAAARIFRLAHSWFLVNGVPDEVKMTVETLCLWGKLGAFCASL